MKKLAALYLAIMFALILFVCSGCGVADNPSGGQKNVPDNTSTSSKSVCVSVIDVGKGDCILVQAGSASALIDTGYDDTASDVVSHLQKRGVDHLDYLVLTHYDKDHVDGTRAIGRAFGIGKVFLPGYEGGDKHYRSAVAAVESLGVPTQAATTTQTLKLGDASFTILPTNLAYDPDAKGDEGNDNDLSLVVTLTFKGDSYLFAGDLEEEGISAYLRGRHGRFDVLKVPHHGEKADNTDEFLADVQPEIAIITDSFDDPASKKTLKLLDGIGADTYRTSTHGTVVIQSDGTGKYAVSTDDD